MALVVSAMILSPSLISPALVMAAANCGYTYGFHYGAQHTSHLDNQIECPQPGYPPIVPDLYYGWNGVIGQIKTPASQLQLGNPLFDHALGFLSAQFDHAGAAPDTWLQIGWYKGTVAFPTPDPEDPCLAPACIRRQSTYGWYAENMGVSGFSVKDLGMAGLSAVNTLRVVYNVANNCWEAFLTYSGVRQLWECNTEPSTGGMVASIEALSDGATVPIPLTYFGASNPNTNQALRLHGANGWEPWDTSLLAWGTQSRDERNAVPRYVKSDFNAHFYFRAYGP